MISVRGGQASSSPAREEGEEGKVLLFGLRGHSLLRFEKKSRFCAGRTRR